MSLSTAPTVTVLLQTPPVHVLLLKTPAQVKVHLSKLKYMEHIITYGSIKKCSVHVFAFIFIKTSTSSE